MSHSLSGLTKVCFSIDNLERILSGWNAAHWESLEPARGPTPHIHPQPPERSKGERSPQRGSEMGVALGDDWCCCDRCSKAPAEGKALLGWAGLVLWNVSTRDEACAHQHTAGWAPTWSGCLVLAECPQAAPHRATPGLLSTHTSSPAPGRDSGHSPAGSVAGLRPSWAACLGWGPSLYSLRRVRGGHQLYRGWESGERVKSAAKCQAPHEVRKGGQRLLAHRQEQGVLCALVDLAQPRDTRPRPTFGWEKGLYSPTSAAAPSKLPALPRHGISL